MEDIPLNPEVTLLWRLANNEAQLSGSDLIEPVHFWIALLSILDNVYLTNAYEIGLNPTQLIEIHWLSKALKSYIGLSNEEITSRRQQLQEQLH